MLRNMKGRYLRLKFKVIRKCLNKGVSISTISTVRVLAKMIMNDRALPKGHWYAVASAIECMNYQQKSEFIRQCTKAREKNSPLIYFIDEPFKREDCK